MRDPRAEAFGTKLAVKAALTLIASFVLASNFARPDPSVRLDTSPPPRLEVPQAAEVAPAPEPVVERAAPPTEEPQAPASGIAEPAQPSAPAAPVPTAAPAPKPTTQPAPSPTVRPTPATTPQTSPPASGPSDGTDETAAT